MTITRITPLEPIGTPRIDISFTQLGERVKIKWLTPEGYLWIRLNMDHDDFVTVVVQKEFLEELKDQMRKDGLNV